MKKYLVSILMCLTLVLCYSDTVYASRDSIYNFAKNFEITICRAFIDAVEWNIEVGGADIAFDSDEYNLDVDYYSEEFQLGTFEDNYSKYGFSKDDFEITYYYDSNLNCLLQFFLYKDGRVAYVMWTDYGFAERAYWG